MGKYRIRACELKKQAESQPEVKVESNSKKISKITTVEIKQAIRRKIESKNTMKSKIKEKRKWKVDFIKSINRQNLTCPICLQLMMNPCYLNCGHIFCQKCLDDISQISTINKRCPTCRQELNNKELSRSKRIGLIIKQYVLRTLSKEEQKRYQLRWRSVEEEYKERMDELKRVSIGDIVMMRNGMHWERMYLMGKPVEKDPFFVVRKLDEDIFYQFEKETRELRKCPAKKVILRE